MGKLSNVRALIFDAYNTLFDTDSIIGDCEAAFPGHGEAICKLWRENQLRYTRQCVLLRRYTNLWELIDKALAKACHQLKQPCSPELRHRLREQYLRLKVFPEVPVALDALGKHYTLAILSNGTFAAIAAVAAHNNIQQAFVAILSADRVRDFKPSARVYELAARTLQLPRAEIAYISTNPFDMAGAKGFGMTTIWLHRFTPPSRFMDIMADASVANLSELVTQLLGHQARR